MILTPTERRPVRGALAPVAAVNSSHQGLPVGCLWFTHDLSGTWQERKGDHVWEKRCSSDVTPGNQSNVNESPHPARLGQGLHHETSPPHA